MILAHQYDDEISSDIQSYARHHGLSGTRSSAAATSEWYGAGTIAVELRVPPEWPLWPIERAATILLVTQPVSWQDDI